MRRIGGNIRVAGLAVIVSTVAFVAVLVSVQVAALAQEPAAEVGLSLGNSLIVPGVESLVGGQRVAAELARRANPGAVAARERSRTAYAHLRSNQAGRLLLNAFPNVIMQSANAANALPAGARIVGYPSSNSVQIALPGGQLGIAESSWPLAKRTSRGHFAPLDLKLTRSGAGYVPVRSSVAVQIPRELSSGIRTPENNVTLTPVDSSGRTLAGSGAVYGASVIYTNTAPATDTVVKPTPTGFQVDAVLRSVGSPQQLLFKVGIPAGATLRQEPGHGPVQVLMDGHTLATILPPSATDAAGTAVPASMSMAGKTISVSVEHRAGSYLYPIDVDPEVNDSQLATTTGGKRTNWKFETSNEARFGHKAVYEGPGKEHLETSGAAEYLATEFGAWTYVTKGNSKIYELKTKTSAKNKSAKIESFLQFVSPGGSENRVLLSTEGSEPEYSEKASTICGWNASKVEECLPGAGKEQNLVRFEQAATAAPGAGYKFLDTMSEAVVSISEPSGEHSTTKFNTTSPEVSGEVEGKMQKRVNALYGAGIWLTKFKGALQFIGKDPGIGVATTRLEYEKPTGGWEKLSEHHYMEENGCEGVQCYYPEHAEYWTVDPKLPDGEDKIRYRAEEAITGTVSPESEAESTKIVRVDTAAPRSIRLSGLPYGNELSEKPYKLSAEATDGQSPAVASSGVKSLALFVSGHEVAVLGTQTGCSVSIGECSAKAEWSINGAELGAGHHAIVIVATDNAGNESRLEETISIRHSTPVAVGPGSVDLQSGDFALSATDVSLGSGLTVSRNYSSRSVWQGTEGALGAQWNISLGSSESLLELVDGSVLLTSSNGSQSIFASLGSGKFESPTGDSNLKLELEENKITKEKLAYYLKNSAAGTSDKFTLPAGSKTWVPTKQEGTVATDTLTYSYRTLERHTDFKISPSGISLAGLTTGPEGNMWFTSDEPEGEKEFIGKMTPEGQVLAEYPVGRNNKPTTIITGPDGNLWYIEAGNTSVVSISPSGKFLTSHDVRFDYEEGHGGAADITDGSDGAIWMTLRSKNKIGRWTMDQKFTSYTLPAGSSPTAITSGPDGNLWFTETGKIAKITTTGTITEYPLPGGVTASDITAGGDGNLWFTESGTKKVGKITTAGVVTEYTVPEVLVESSITLGSDKNVWFTGSGYMVKITPAGTSTIYRTTPANSHLAAITAGPYGDVWYANNIGEKFSPMNGAISVLTDTTEPTEVLAPVPAGVSCSPEMKAGCRSLKFLYSSSNELLNWVYLDAYEPVAKKMQETAVAEYTYNEAGWLTSEWDPRQSLKTTYGYDPEGHLTALTPPGQETWAFTYGTIPGDSGTGRLLKIARAPASQALWSGEAVKNSVLPQITGSPVVGVRMTVSDGTWTGSPVTYGYQWVGCTIEGVCTPIPGANNANYIPTWTDSGHTLQVLVTATNGSGSIVAASAASAKVEFRKSTEYSLPSGSHPFEITSGPDGNMWLTNISTGKVDKVTMTGGITEYATEKDEPEGITTGPDQNLWFVEHSIRHVNHMTTSGALTTYTLTRTGTYNVGIVKGPDGNLWFTESESKYIVKINTKDEVLGEYLLPTGSKPYGIAVGPDGNLWFADNGTDKVGKITTSGVITEYALPAGSKPYGLLASTYGDMLVTENGTSKIGKVNVTTGAVTEYALPAGSQPRAIAMYKEKPWIAEYGTNSLAEFWGNGAVISQYSLPTGSQPNGLAAGPDGNLWVTAYGTNKIVKFNPTGPEEGAITEGAARNPVLGYTLEYGTPLSGSGLPTMTSGEVAQWGQTDDPVEATAILPPDADQGWPATSDKRATIYYLDAHGRTVNVSNPSNATYGSVATTEYNELNDEVRTLSADNRQAALEAGSKSADTAKSLATYYTYREECSKESENKHESESLEPGTRLCETEGPQHEIKYLAGGEQREELGRLHTKYFYDESAPSGETYNLKTKSSSIAELANEEEVEVRKTTTSYSGQSNLGWKLRAPTSVTADPEGKKLTTTTVYNSATAQVVETRAPAGSVGESAHDTKYIYYTAAANTEGYAVCGSHPEWAGLVCETLPAKQPETGGLPKLPVSVVTYNMWNEPLVTTDTFGTTVRTKTQTYDGAGRLTGSEVTSTANTALPKVTNEYNSKTGVLEKQSTTVEAKTKTVTSKYNTLGQMIEYTDADGNIAKYRYAGPENDYLLEEMTDGSNAGTGKQTYTYNATTKAREELWDSAAGTFSASYDAEGQLVNEVYPNAMCAKYAHNPVGEVIHIEYAKTANCSEAGAPVWFSEARAPSVRGETLSRANTLTSDTYVYDSLGRLTEAHETPAGEGCTTRLYGYDEESNRTSQTTRVPGTGGKCATEGGAVQAHTYDEGNRLTDTGISYDSFGNVTKLPAADAEGHELSSTFYVDGAVATQSQNGVTNNYYLDPEGRVRETVSGAATTITHYDGSGEGVTWTSENEGKSTRNIAGVDGTLSAIQTNGGTPVLQLHDIQGDVVATAALSPTETKLLSTYNSTEFGVPNAGKTPPKYAWLGATDVASAFSSGVITYGATSYVPQTGRALQSEAVEPPGAPQGTGVGAPYTFQAEPWVFQSAASAAAEAPGREAAREQAALEAALVAADPRTYVTMHRLKARELGEQLNDIGTLGEFLDIFLDLPKDLEKLLESSLIDHFEHIEEALDWFHESGQKLIKCSNNKSVLLRICKFEYDQFELSEWGLTLIFPNPWGMRPVVEECYPIGSAADCVHTVDIPKAPEE